MVRNTSGVFDDIGLPRRQLGIIHRGVVLQVDGLACNLCQRRLGKFDLETVVSGFPREVTNRTTAGIADGIIRTERQHNPIGFD